MVMLPRDKVQTPPKSVKIQNFNLKFELIDVQHYIWLSAKFQKASYPRKPKFFGEFGSNIYMVMLPKDYARTSPKNQLKFNILI